MSDKENKPIASVVIDYETGEIIKEIYYGDLIKVFSKEQLEHRRKYKVINKNCHFVKTICKATDILAKEHLTASENSIIWAMLNNVGIKEFSGYLIKVQMNLFCGFMNETELRAKTNLTDKTFLSAIQRLVDKRIIALETDEKDKRNNRILVNPFIFMKDIEITTYLYELFKDTKWNYNEQ